MYNVVHYMCNVYYINTLNVHINTCTIYTVHVMYNIVHIQLQYMYIQISNLHV